MGTGSGGYSKLYGAGAAMLRSSPRRRTVAVLVMSGACEGAWKVRPWRVSMCFSQDLQAQPRWPWPTRDEG